jgi:deazaflavin-dependent oxidoreductase (nitroreductase family)
VPHDVTLKVMNRLHRAALKISGGRVGWTAGRMPVLELTTTGRRTGRPRAVMLTSPVRDGDALVVVASRGGDDRSPAWFLNLVADSDVLVAVQGAEPVRMRATVADAEQRSRLWPQVTADHLNYAGYQLKTEREIPLVLLRPSA